MLNRLILADLSATNGIAGAIWEILISKVAIIVYISLILVLVLFLVVRVMLNESRRAAEVKERAKNVEEISGDNIVNKIGMSLEKNKHEIQESIDEVRFKVNNLSNSNFAKISPLETSTTEEKSCKQDDVQDQTLKTESTRFYMLSQISPSQSLS